MKNSKKKNSKLSTFKVDSTKVLTKKQMNSVKGGDRVLLEYYADRVALQYLY